MRGRLYLICPDCGRKRVTYREFSDGDGYACDRCDWTCYCDEEPDQRLLQELKSHNPSNAIRFAGGEYE